MTTPEPDYRDDELVRTISTDGSIAVRTLVARNLVAEAAERRPLAPTALAALGRLLAGTVLLATGPVSKNKQDVETVQLQFRGNGPLGMMVALCDSTGRVRGTVSNPSVDLPLRDGQPDVAKAIGLGTLSVVRSRPSWREPHSGTVPLVSGEVAADIALYLSESEQTPSAVGLGVAVGTEGRVDATGGFLVQSLPYADAESVTRLERNVRELPSTSALLLDGVRAEGLADLLLEGLGARTLHRSMPVFYCPCSRDRALRTLLLLGRDEMLEIIDIGEPQEVGCEFCGRRYQLDSDEIRPLVPHESA
jgi:molecular chaperone Hsp33